MKLIGTAEKEVLIKEALIKSLADRLFLISCVKNKGNQRTAAADLYTSPWFLKARQVAERYHAPWFILSAKYGLVAPDTIIYPYEVTLNNMRKPERLAWADMVERQMDKELPDVEEIIIFAGKKYREHLMPYLQGRFTTIKVPMKNFRIGCQLKWLKNDPKI